MKNNSAEKYGVTCFENNSCFLFVKDKQKNVTSTLATISPYKHVTEKVQKAGFLPIANTLFVVSVKDLRWVVIPMPPNIEWPEEQWIDALDLGQELSEKLNVKTMVYQSTHPEECICYQLFESGRESDYFKHAAAVHALCGAYKSGSFDESNEDPQGWVNRVFTKFRIAVFPIDYELIIRNLSETGFGGKEVDRLNCEITRIDAVN